MQPQPPQSPEKRKKKLGIIFDIDGTLVAEGRKYKHIIRPGAIEFLQWCIYDRGHSIGIWTASGQRQADNIAQLLNSKILLLQQKRRSRDNDGIEETETTTTTTANDATSSSTKMLFSFVWGSNRMRKRSTSVPLLDGDDDESSATAGDKNSNRCRWCGPYTNNCTRCQCYTNTYACPCRFTKDLRKIWSWSKQQQQQQQQQQKSSISDVELHQSDNNSNDENVVFTKQRTIIIENTPQQCIHNYGNAIYVPTFYGPGRTPSPYECKIFSKLQHFIVNELEPSHISSVRHVVKCNHCYDDDVVAVGVAVGVDRRNNYNKDDNKVHACFEQSWWYYQDF